MLFLELQNQQASTAAVAVARNDTKKTNNDIRQTRQQLAALQVAQGTASQDISSAKAGSTKGIRDLGLLLKQLQESDVGLVQGLAATRELATNRLRDLDNSFQQRLQETVAGLVRGLDESRESVANRLRNLDVSLQQQFQEGDAASASALRVAQQQVDRLETLSYSNLDKHTQLGQFLSGNIKLTLDAESEDVSAAALNAAAVGTFQRTVLCALSYLNDDESIGGTHEWASFEPPVTGGNTGCWNPDVKWAVDQAKDPRFVNGLVQVLVTFATDAGVAKVYEIGDTVTVEFQVAEDDKWFGLTVTAVTKTYNVIA